VFSTQIPAWPSKLMMLDEHPCYCGGIRYIRMAYNPPGHHPLMYYRYRCLKCGILFDTAEVSAGQPAEITPRSKRGRTPHPLR
jgi:hypothetical protein